MFKDFFKKKKPETVPTPSLDSGNKKKSGLFSSIKDKFKSGINNKIGRSAVKGEEIVGVEITNKEIILAQISSDKSNQWILEKFFIHPVDLPEDALVLENADKLGSELGIAIQKSKIATGNAAIQVK